MKEGEIIFDKTCFVLFKEISDQMGTDELVCVSTDKDIILEKEKTITKHRTYIKEIPFLERFKYEWNDDFEPLGCHGCGDW